MIDPDDPGLLGALRGAEISRATDLLPPVESAAADSMAVVFDSEFQGRVRMTCARTPLKHGKAKWRAWVAVYAEAAPGAPLGVVQPPL